MSKAIFWFRQDLRLEDNPGLYQACTNHSEIILLYIQDTPISELKKTAQSWWLHHSLQQLSQSLATHKLQLCLKKGNPEDIFKDILQQHQIDAVYWNRCYEPQHIQRDQHLKTWLKQLGIQAQSYNSQLLNEPWEVKNQQGGFFKVFTPYWKQCLKQLQIQHPIQIQSWPMPINFFGDSLDDWQLLPNQPNWASQFDALWQPGEKGAEARLENFIQHKLSIYKSGRDFPALQATSNLSPHLHFGEISPWKIYRKVSSYLLEYLEHDDQIKHFLSELGWREFSYHLLFHFPTLASENFKSNFNGFPWHNDDAAFLRWKKGQTGYPIVDAGMRELWHTGTMHNRVRMIVASFLVKDLFIDWRKGAEWFNLTLLDADMASNYASWQWVAGSGADAAPYFRIFNPVLQGEKFDPEGKYVRKWVKELEKLPNQWIHHPWDAPSHQLPITLGLHYPHPMVNHNQARDQALSYYQKIKHQLLD
jgi:deoxyribodipyrimidine photo-lyase